MKSGLKSGSFIRKAEREARERERVRGREVKLGSDKMSQSYKVRKIFKLKVRGKISVIVKPKSRGLGLGLGLKFQTSVRKRPTMNFLSNSSPD